MGSSDMTGHGVFILHDFFHVSQGRVVGGQYIVLCYLGWGSGQVASGPDKGPWWLECWVWHGSVLF